MFRRRKFQGEKIRATKFQGKNPFQLSGIQNTPENACASPFGLRNKHPRTKVWETKALKPKLTLINYTFTSKIGR